MRERVVTEYQPVPKNPYKQVQTPVSSNIYEMQTKQKPHGSPITPGF